MTPLLAFFFAMDAKAAFSSGRQRFSTLFTGWMDRNGWSHPTIVQLATAALELPSRKGWLHSSQVSGLRHAKLENPGPRTFIGIAALNRSIHEFQTTGKTLPGIKRSLYDRAVPYLVEGEPPSAAWWAGVFMGEIEPEGLENDRRWFDEERSAIFSLNFGKKIRLELASKGLDIVEDLDTAIRKYYPTQEKDRVENLRKVIMQQGTWDGDQLVNELPALSQMLTLMGVSTETEDLHLLANQK